MTQTVVLDYAAVLDYIAEKEKGAVTRQIALPAGPGAETTRLPVVADKPPVDADKDGVGCE